MAHDMIISLRKLSSRIDAGAVEKCDFEDVQLCQKSSVKAEPLSGSITLKDTVLLSVLKGTMYSYITAPLLVTGIVHCLKAKRSSLLRLKATRAGKLPRYLPPEYLPLGYLPNKRRFFHPIPGTAFKLARYIRAYRFRARTCAANRLNIRLFECVQRSRFALRLLCS